MQISLTGALRSAAGNAAEIEIEAKTIRELLRKLVEQYPRMDTALDEGIAVSINGQIYRDVMDVDIPEGAEVFLLPRLQGG